MSKETPHLPDRRSAVSSLGKRLLSFGRRLCLPDQESAEIRTGEYRRRAVDGDLPAPTRVWSRLLPRREPALRSPRTELLPGQETWIWSSTDSMSSSRTSAFDKETLVDVPIFPIIQVLRRLTLGAEVLMHYQRQCRFLLPKYSPDLDLIEQVFAKLKHVLHEPPREPSKPIRTAIGEILGTFTSEHAPTISKIQGMPTLKSSRFYWHGLLMDRSDHADDACLTDHALRSTIHQFLKCNLIVSVKCDPMSASSRWSFMNHDQTQTSWCCRSPLFHALGARNGPARDL
jgi:hypothetical protein